MKNKRLITGSLITLFLIILSFLFDVKIVQFFVGLRNLQLDSFFIGVSFLSNILIIFFILTSLFLWNENKRRWIFPLWLSGFFAIVISFIMKSLIARPRPYQEGSVQVLGIALKFIEESHSVWNFSFPSFHAMLVFASLPILIKEFKKIRYVWFVFACLVAFSRMYFGVHYMSDILAGALIGYLIGCLMIVVEEKKEYGKRLMRRIRL